MHEPGPYRDLICATHRARFLGRTTLAAITGFVAASVGWVIFFALCAAAALPGLAIRWLVTKRGAFTEIEKKEQLADN